MSPKPPLLIFAIYVIMALTNCKKNEAKSSNKYITSFNLKAVDNAAALTTDIFGVIETDTILLPIPQGIPVNNLIPAISFVGAKISPASNVAQNFTNPVRYTVSALDGSVKSYIAVVKTLSDTKDITSFVFKVFATHPGLSADIAGTISNDTIVVLFNSNINVNGLTPSIISTGKTVDPAAGTKRDFTGSVSYTVTAEDGTFKVYSVFVETNQALYIGSDEGYLYALDATMGALKWKYATGGGIRSSPTLYNGSVYVGSIDGFIYSIDAVTGALKWKYPTGKPVYSSPTVAGGIVYVTIYSYLIALDAATGRLQWQFNTNDILGGSASPTVSNGIVYEGTFSGLTVGAFDALTGTLKWSYTGQVSASNPAVVNGTVYSGAEGEKIVALDALTGSKKFDYNNNSMGSPAGPTVSNGHIFIGTYDGYLYAFDSATGSVQWKYASTNNESISPSQFSSPVTFNGLVFAGSDDGIFAFDANTGTLKWSLLMTFLPGDNGQVVNPTVANGILYCGSTDGNIYSLDAQTGQIKWAFKTKAGVYSGPCIADVNGNIFHPGISGDHQ